MYSVCMYMYVYVVYLDSIEESKQHYHLKSFYSRCNTELWWLQVQLRGILIDYHLHAQVHVYDIA
jgi:hypothetical protein